MEPFFVLIKLPNGSVQCEHDVDAIDDIREWGIHLADAIRHIARAREQNLGEVATAVEDQIVSVIRKEIKLIRKDPSRGNISGSIIGIN